MNYSEKALMRENEKLKNELKFAKMEATNLRRKVNIIRLTSQDEVMCHRLRSIIESQIKTNIAVHSREREIVDGRRMYYHYLCFNSGMTIKAISSSLGLCHDHSTVIHARDTFDDILSVDKNIRKTYEYICHQMKHFIVDEPIINAS